MNREEQDDLWELLGQARPAKVSPFFSRNVLRAIREEEKGGRPGVVAWWRSRWALLGVGACAAVAVTLALISQPSPQPQPAESPEALVALAEDVSASPDYAVIGNLDELLAAVESSVWLENPTF